MTLLAEKRLRRPWRRFSSSRACCPSTSARLAPPCPPFCLQVPRPYTCLLPLSSVSPGHKRQTCREAGRTSSRLRHVPGRGGECAPEVQCRLGDEDAQVISFSNRISPHDWVMYGCGNVCTSPALGGGHGGVDVVYYDLYAEFFLFFVAARLHHRVEGAWVLSSSSVGTTGLPGRLHGVVFMRSRPYGFDRACRWIDATGQGALFAIGRVSGGRCEPSQSREGVDEGPGISD